MAKIKCCLATILLMKIGIGVSELDCACEWWKPPECSCTIVTQPPTAFGPTQLVCNCKAPRCKCPADQVACETPCMERCERDCSTEAGRDCHDICAHTCRFSCSRRHQYSNASTSSTILSTRTHGSTTLAVTTTPYRKYDTTTARTFETTYTTTIAPKTASTTVAEVTHRNISIRACAPECMPECTLSCTAVRPALSLVRLLVDSGESSKDECKRRCGDSCLKLCGASMMSTKDQCLKICSSGCTETCATVDHPSVVKKIPLQQVCAHDCLLECATRCKETSSLPRTPCAASCVRECTPVCVQQKTAEKHIGGSADKARQFFLSFLKA